jgi:hypothetical protein
VRKLGDKAASLQMQVNSRSSPDVSLPRNANNNSSNA